MTQAIHSHVYPNGLVLLAEPMPWLRSAAFSIYTPAGCVYDPADRPGLAAFTCEMVLRGAGSRSSRQFIIDLDNLGIERSGAVSNSHSSFSGATVADNLLKGISIFSDVLRRPRLPDDELEWARQGCLQEIRAVEDEPGQKLVDELEARQFPDPWGRPAHGTTEAVEQITLDEIRAFHARHFRPGGSIVAVAGRFDWPAVVDCVGSLLGDWPAQPEPELVESSRRTTYDHIGYEASQTQIGIAYDAVPYRHPDYFLAWGAVRVLSGGMSSRLFTEVRERRGLCYSVYASYHTLRDRGAVLCHAGTTAERAQETLDVTMSELVRLADGVLPEELDRLKARAKSSLIMQQESSGARAGAIARDWYHLGRTRSLDELGELVDGLSADAINGYLTRRPPGDFTVVTLGPKPLEVRGAVS